MDIKNRINEIMDPLLGNLGRLVQYNSVLSDPKPGMPFGEENAKVLAEALAIAEEMGFRTVNLDNYCGYAEVGEGDQIIGIAGHLDIVPVGDGWSYDPLKVTQVGDRVYGRGVTDDKGPVLLALTAVKLLQESGVKLNKRIRVIMGCNEETGSKCMEHYMQVDEPLTMGFTPDANFPGIYGEKGMLAMLATSRNTKILSMNGGFVTNAVCHKCTTVIPAGSVDLSKLREALAQTPLVSFSVTPATDGITIQAEGKAAHASTPLLGVNAASYTMAALKSAGFQDDFVDFYCDRIGTACDGSGCGINFVDAYGDLTFNNGIVSTKDGVITCTIDCRVPVTITEEQLRAALAPYLEGDNGKLEIKGIHAPLFFPKESPMVQALAKAYVDVTGDTENQLQVIGGGTYAKSLPGIIAFGPERPNMDYRIHNADEFGLIPEMKEAIEVYMKAIENLLAL